MCLYSGRNPKREPKQTRKHTRKHMKKEIEFETSNDGKIDPTAEIPRSGGGGSYRSIVFKDPLGELKLKLSQGKVISEDEKKKEVQTWLRFVPSVKGSQYSWLMKLMVHKDKGGVTFVAPATFDPSAKDAFSKAYFWLKKNKPELVYNRENPNGFKLYASPVGVAWAIVAEAPEGQRLRLFEASMNDGEKGSTGLAYEIWRAANERDTEPSESDEPTTSGLVNGDIVAPGEGRQVCVTSIIPNNREVFPQNNAKIGSKPAPIQKFMDLLTDSERELIVPIEKAVYVPTESEIIEILAGYIGSELTKEILG